MALVLLGLRNISAPSLVYSIPGILLLSAYLTISFPLRCRVTNRRQATAAQAHYHVVIMILSTCKRC